MLKSGYSHKTIRDNTLALLRENLPIRNIRAIVLARARVSFFRKFPQGYLPWELQNPKRRGVKECYQKDGKPIHETFAPRMNPAPMSDIHRANQLYESFSGEPGKVIGRTSAPKMPDTLVAIGRVTALEYDARRDRKMNRYRHEFAAHAQPLFAVNPDGKSVWLLGGSYSFTERGIIDFRPRKHNR